MKVFLKLINYNLSKRWKISKNIDFLSTTTALILFFILSSCIRFKIDDMSPSIVARIRLGVELDKLQAEILNNSLVNVPLRIPINSDRFYITDYKNSLLKVFLRNGKLDYIIGRPEQKQEDIKIMEMRIVVPGLVAVSEEDEIYIQNRISSAISTNEEIKDRFLLASGYFSMREYIHAPSYIQAINRNKDEFYIIGMEGKNSEPFRYIESMTTGNNGSLFVLHKIADQLVLSHYINGVLNGKISESNLKIFDSEESLKYNIILDNIIPIRTGDYALLSFKFSGKTDDRFKFRRVYRYQFNSDNSSILLKEFLDPSEVLLGVKTNGDFYIWETETGGNTVKIQVHDKEGNHISNKRLTFSIPRILWRETYMDYKDLIYSLRIDAGYLEIYEWK
jgi:hypothetical protein